MKKLVIAILGVGLVVACGNGQQPVSTQSGAETKVALKEVVGEAQGTTYSIKYSSEEVAESVLKPAVDSLLLDIDNSLSTWVPTSLISELNNSEETEITFDDHFNYFTEVFKNSRKVYSETRGAFNPTVGPLSNAWGFGFKNREQMTPERVEALLPLVGFEYDDIRLTRKTEESQSSPERVLVKRDAKMELDFNAIAQGYSVDVLGRMLREMGIASYMIELGGEVLTSGLKPDGEKWRIGIDEPKETLEERSLNAVLELTDIAVATSGNYRKFYEIDGVKYAHTLDPKTGYPVKHGMLSATVLAATCWEADAMATAFMVMGPDSAMAYMDGKSELELAAYFIYNDEEGNMKTYLSKGMEAYLRPVKD